MPSSLPLPVVIAKPPPPPLTPRTAAPSPFARVGTYKSQFLDWRVRSGPS